MTRVNRLKILLADCRDGRETKARPRSEDVERGVANFAVLIQCMTDCMDSSDVQEKGYKVIGHWIMDTITAEMDDQLQIMANEFTVNAVMDVALRSLREHSESMVMGTSSTKVGSNCFSTTWSVSIWDTIGFQSPPRFSIASSAAKYPRFRISKLLLPATRSILKLI